MKITILDPADPFYRPLWRRVAIVGVCLGWAAFEGWRGAFGWAAIAAALGLYAGYHLLLTYRSGGGKSGKTE